MNHEDHQVIVRLLDPNGERFGGKVHTLDRLWTHHDEEEEDEW